MARIAVIPGDGAGIEVAKEGVAVLQAIAQARKLPLEFEHFDFGAERYLQTGVAMPPGQLEKFRDGYDAILFGAVGDPRVKDNAHAREILLGLRFGLDLYVNFRPCRLLADRLSPLKDKGTKEIDFVVFRENTEGMYNAIGGVFKKGTPDEVSVAEEINTRKGVERIIRAAFAWARKHGKKRVAMADKSNAIGAHELWVRTFREVAKEYPEVEAKHFYIDALAMQLVLKPELFDVIVTTNLFGDILTDLGAALTGGMGLAPSANLNPDSTPLFEPVHGSAPDIAGKGLVNPCAMFLTSALMLEELGHPEEARLLEAAVQRTVAEGKSTRDIGGTLSTSEVTAEVLRHLRASL
ncbi:MAG TPA: isocitrate/isopropylmalate dehydrogenase family protein [Myxococcaceae bacterium]|nr:isocitrate/isopropylmalate dehydrogenase family protein [Myxococcaceae bacterium]